MNTTNTDDSGPETLKETLISIVIAFALAFVGRSYVIEPFVIPTGSMAPTLNGAHMRMHSPFSGFDWAVNPRDGVANGQRPLRLQGARTNSRGPIIVTDPVTHEEISRVDQPLRSGDRILVLKYLYALLPPRRFDVVVFKNPENPQENFIKRLIGLPGEELWLCDGDLFVRKPEASDPSLQAWRIQRKPKRIQDSVWWPVFSSEYTPPESALRGRTWSGPWEGDAWDVLTSHYRHEGAAPAELRWDSANWPITDSTPYNETVERTYRDIPHVPISDVRMRAGVEPDAAGITLHATLTARRHEFQAALTDGRATLRMRRQGAEDWTTLADADAPALAPGRATEVEFLHVDQSLELRIAGTRIAYAEYDWSPELRLEMATIELAQRDRGAPLADPHSYRAPEVAWTFIGASVTLHHVGLDRDLHWRTDVPAGWNNYARATAPGTVFQLQDEEFFMCGDNSPSSRDSRMWDSVDPWVAATFDNRPGVVPRRLLMGKAFFVYFPAPHVNLGPIPVPDFGRLRFIK